MSNEIWLIWWGITGLCLFCLPLPSPESVFDCLCCWQKKTDRLIGNQVMKEEALLWHANSSRQLSPSSVCQQGSGHASCFMNKKFKSYKSTDNLSIWKEIFKCSDWNHNKIQAVQSFLPLFFFFFFNLSSCVGQSMIVQCHYWFHSQLKVGNSQLVGCNYNFRDCVCVRLCQISSWA